MRAVAHTMAGQWFIRIIDLRDFPPPVSSSGRLKSPRVAFPWNVDWFLFSHYLGVYGCH